MRHLVEAEALSLEVLPLSGSISCNRQGGHPPPPSCRRKSFYLYIPAGFQHLGAPSLLLWLLGALAPCSSRLPYLPIIKSVQPPLKIQKIDCHLIPLRRRRACSFSRQRARVGPTLGTGICIVFAISS